MTEPRHFPVFETRPDETFVSGWREAIKTTGYPELYENVSTSRPYNMEGVVILSGEIEVATVKRLDQSLVPCPLCSPNSPKFKTGRIAYFPHEKTVMFIGHKCAKRHMGEEYVAADRRYWQESRVRTLAAMWGDVQRVAPKALALAEDLLPAAAALEAAKAQLAVEAEGFLGMMRDEFMSTNGRITYLVDTGLREQNERAEKQGRKGKKVYQEAQLGTLVGREFLEPTQPATKLRRAIRHLAHANEPLPTWTAGDEDERLEEIIHRGKEAVSAINQIRAIRDYVAAARLFLHERNMDLFEKWGDLDNSPFDTINFRRKGRWIFLEAVSFQGRHQAYFQVSDDLFAALPDVRYDALAISGMRNVD